MAVEVRASTAPEVTKDAVTFYLPDADLELREVQLIQELQRPRLGPPFRLNEDTRTWALRFRRPAADRMEYMFYLRHDDESEASINDPSNPDVAPGPFGAKSVIEFPGYRAPGWIYEGDVPSDAIVDTEIGSRTLRARLHTQIWTPEGREHDEPLPLLVAHDGPEYNKISDLLKFLRHKIASGDLLPFRVGLIAPVDRNQIYSASAAYARAFSYEVLPALERLAPAPHGRSMRIGMGASLGALAMLHIHRLNPATFGGLFLQSGSFFRQRFDKQESGFPRFGRISRFMGRVLTASQWQHPIPIAMTCGSVEENLANNRATYRALKAQDYPVTLHENRDGHNWVAWRDTFEPHLSDLLAKVWS